MAQPFLHHFTRGIGKLSARLLNELMDTIMRSGAMEARLRQLMRDMDRSVVIPFRPVLLCGYRLPTSPSGIVNRWEYAWAEGSWDSATKKLGVRTGGLNSYEAFNSANLSAGSPFTRPAYNLIENGNDGLGIESGRINIESTLFLDADFYLQPIAGQPSPGPPTPDPGTNVFTTVARAPAALLFSTRDSTGQQVRFITAANIADGECGG